MSTSSCLAACSLTPAHSSSSPCSQSMPRAKRSDLSINEASVNAWFTPRWLTAFIAVAAVLALTACNRGGAQAGPGGFPPAPVTLQEVKTVDVPIRFEYVGQTAGSKEAEVRARVQGILERRTYEEGGRVKAGQTLFVIDSRPYAAQVQAAEADLSRAQAQYTQARRNLERLKPLAGSQAVSQREFDEAVSGEESAAAAVKQAQARLVEARLNLGYTTVTAPVSGFASRAQKSEGSLVTPGQDSLLTTVSQIDPLDINFSVSENEQLRLNRLLASGKLEAPEAEKSAKGKSNSNSGYVVQVRLADGNIYPRSGHLIFIDSRINGNTGSFDARAQVPNPDYMLRPGQFVRVIVEGATRPDTVVVPQRAVMDGPQGKFVYVAGKGEKGNDVALPRPVTVSDWVQLDGQQQWIVESGLKPGDKVITDGTAKIFPIPGGAPIMLGPPAGAGAPAAAAGAAPAAEPGKAAAAGDAAKK